MAGKLVIDTIQDGAGNSTSATNAIQGSAKAWVNFDGTTLSRRASYNVSSITRFATGSFYVNFASAFPDANYCAVGSLDTGAVTPFSIKLYPDSTTRALVSTVANGALADFAINHCAFFR